MTDLDVAWEALLASGEQPPRAEWARLVAELRNAASELADGRRHPTLPPGMAPILRVLIAVNDYLRGSPAVQAEPQLVAPLLHVITVIYQMANGSAAPLFPCSSPADSRLEDVAP